MPVHSRLFRRPRFIFLAAIIVLVLLAAAVFVVSQILSQPAIGSELPLQCQVRVSDPASGLIDVRMEFPAGALNGRPYLDLTFWDLKRRPEALKTVSAWVDGQPLVVTRPFWKGAHERRIRLGGASGTLVVEYSLDPTYYPPGAQVTEAADAVSRVTADLAILRTTSSFPVMNPAGLTIRAVFRLPDTWVAVTPWQADGDGFLIPPEQQTNEYVALGPFDVQEMTVENTTMRAAVIPAASGMPLETIDSILRFELDLIGAPPPGAQAVYTVIVVPPDFLNGGSAGRHSTVQVPAPDTLAHEMFHWWNSSSHTLQEAQWFQEGFTEYYGIKIARDSGAWLPEQADQCLADLNGEMRFLEEDQPRSLVDVSRNSRSDSYARRLVYSKGALFALLLDRQLKAEGRSLDEVVRAVLTDPRQGLKNDALKDIFHDTFSGMIDGAFEAYVMKGDALPDLGLGAATGESGCARYLPEK
ncbi:MAG: hypothetical protein JW987_03000 [Anaerolineaceae bacterium]|nr:hypothetical protein [Anaerolineaceae bacterium]